jgi:hypothetical protein
MARQYIYILIIRAYILNYRASKRGQKLPLKRADFSKLYNLGDENPHEPREQLRGAYWI